MAFGLFGKLPQKRDFLSVGLPHSVLNPFETWLQQGVAASRAEIGRDWENYYLVSPIWRFWLGKDVLGVAITGSLMPSVDQVGRYFPLAIIYCAEPGETLAPPLVNPNDDWYARIEERLLSVLAQNVEVDVSRLLTGLMAPDNSRPPPKPVVLAPRPPPPPPPPPVAAAPAAAPVAPPPIEEPPPPVFVAPPAPPAAIAAAAPEPEVITEPVAAAPEAEPAVAPATEPAPLVVLGGGEPPVAGVGPTPFAVLGGADVPAEPVAEALPEAEPLPEVATAEPAGTSEDAREAAAAASPWDPSPMGAEKLDELQRISAASFAPEAIAPAGGSLWDLDPVLSPPPAAADPAVAEPVAAESEGSPFVAGAWSEPAAAAPVWGEVLAAAASSPESEESSTGPEPEWMPESMLRPAPQIHSADFKGGVSTSIEGGATFTEALAQLLEIDNVNAAQGRGYWWCGPSSTGGPRLHARQGLPDPYFFTRMLMWNR